MAKVNPCFGGMQVQAYGFAENLHPPSSDSIFHKKPARPNTTFWSHQNNNDRPDGKTHNVERRITLNDNALKKKNDDSNFENVGNEKQNSLTPGIRIGLDENFWLARNGKKE